MARHRRGSAAYGVPVELRVCRSCKSREARGGQWYAAGVKVPRLLRSLGTKLAGLHRADGTFLVSLLAVVAALWLFAGVADLVEDRRSQEVDERIMRSLRRSDQPGQPVGPESLPGMMRDITALGSTVVLVLVVLAVAGFLLVRRQLHACALLVVASGGGALLNQGLKSLFSRPRPDLALHLTEVRSASFPSGHAMASAIIYLTLAAILATMVKPLTHRLYFLGLAALLTLAVGVSRVYLGVHYPTDVLAGWTAGLAWALLCWMVARRLQREGAVEPPE
jgi:undecaprenyl-diphosphatase